MHIIRGNGSVVRGVAALAEACRLLAPITVLCDLLNNPLTQRVYDFIAGRRYTLFGCRESCYVPAVRRAVPSATWQ
jgi:predicted DCC family thiol-disulfide oxidoreductase YuxK